MRTQLSIRQEDRDRLEALRQLLRKELGFNVSLAIAASIAFKEALENRK